MSKRIDVEIDQTGKMKIEFTGFEGETCFEEAEVFQKAVKELGLWALPVITERKSSSEIEQEVGYKHEKPKAVRS
jgi:hypothetical protein